MAIAQGSEILLVDTRPLDEWELGYREWMAPFDPYWQEEQAQKHEQANKWFAAAFHLDQLIRHQPWDTHTRMRLARAYAEQKLTHRAALHGAAAVLLTPHIWLPEANGDEGPKSAALGG